MLMNSFIVLAIKTKSCLQAEEKRLAGGAFQEIILLYTSEVTFIKVFNYIKQACCVFSASQDFPEDVPCGNDNA